MSMSISGRCLCGAVLFSLPVTPRSASMCHCGQCRRWHGHVGVYIDAPWAVVTMDEMRGLAWFRSSDLARRGFCRDCGSSLFWERHGADLVSIAVGALDTPTHAMVDVQIFTDDKGDYYDLDHRITIRHKT